MNNDRWFRYESAFFSFTLIVFYYFSPSRLSIPPSTIACVAGSTCARTTFVDNFLHCFFTRLRLTRYTRVWWTAYLRLIIIGQYGRISGRWFRTINSARRVSCRRRKAFVVHTDFLRANKQIHKIKHKTLRLKLIWKWPVNTRERVMYSWRIFLQVLRDFCVPDSSLSRVFRSCGLIRTLQSPG